MRAAVNWLRQRFGVLQLSPVYETDAVGFDGPAFYNLVAAFDAPDLGQVKAELREMEAKALRRRDGRKFTSRTLDIDILLFGNEDLTATGVDIPRQEIVRYAFVLRPLADVAPDLLHPILGLSISEIWRQFQLEHAQACEQVKQIDFPL